MLVHRAQGRVCGSECGSPSRSLRWLTRPTCRRSRLSPRKTFGDFVAPGEWEQLEGPFLSLRRRSFAWAGPLRLLPSPPECVKTMSAPGRAELFGRQLRSSGRALRGRDFRTRVRLSRPGVSPTRLAPCPMNAAECPVSPGALQIRWRVRGLSLGFGHCTWR